MIPKSSLHKISQCDRCQFYAYNDYIVCALHPAGPLEESFCRDFEPWPDGKIFWAPVGVGFYEVEESTELSRPLSLSPRSLREQLERIEAHPIFSGHCPQCGHKLGYAPRYLWNCDRCGWKDDLSD